MTTGLVLSGGGIRGAYEAGVLTGVVEALGLRATDTPPFDVYAGTSVGAINCAFLASRAHRGDMGADELIEVWTQLHVHDYLHLTPWAVLPMGRLIGRPDSGSLLDPRPLERLLERIVLWDDLHTNVQAGRVRALLVACFDLGSGRTTVFSELAPGCNYAASKDPRRTARLEPVTLEHLLASSAVPLLFPPRRLGNTYFCDGGLRFNTPIAPAIRAGVDRLMVISLLRPKPAHQPVAAMTERPTLTYLLGKVLNGLLLDPVVYDLEVVTRFNRLLEVLSAELSPEKLAQMDRALVETRGAPYRRLETLVFNPSEDIGVMAGAYLREHLPGWDLDVLPRWLLGRLSRADNTWEADWAAYFLFDGLFAARLVDLGRHDALARAPEIRQFFDHQPARATGT